MLIVQGLVFFAIYYFVFLAAIKAMNLKTLSREEDENVKNETIKTNVSNNVLANSLIPLLGGRENIEEIDNCTTRLRLRVRDSALVNDVESKKWCLVYLNLARLQFKL